MTIRGMIQLALVATTALAVLAVPMTPAGAQSSDLLEQLQRFNKILTLVKHNYVDEVETEELINGAIDGLLKDLDPHTNYLKPDANKRMQELNSGEYSGIGISFDILDGVLTVISPIEGSPSFELGIKAGDRIVEIEGESAVGITNTEVFEKLRGPEGSSVEVGIERPGEESIRHYTIIRQKIAIKSVSYHFMLDDETGYVRANRFSAHTADELESALGELEDQGMERLVLDLRGNTGGYLNQAIEVSDKFIGGGKLVVYTKGRIRGSSEEYFSTDGATHGRFPLIVMIDRGSASASEIVSGAVQDWDRGLIVGSTSFGKGLVQRQFPLRGGGALLLTVAKYYTPSGRLIQRPYDDRDRLTYISQAGGGTEEDPHGDLEQGTETLADVEPEDGTAIAEEERPTYLTAAGRPVYGGGGISPDVEIDPDYTLSEIEAKLLNGEDRFFFNFATEYLSDASHDLGEFDEYLSSWEVTDGVHQQFQEYVLTHTEDITAEELVENRDFIGNWIRIELAGNRWGTSERYQVYIANDPAVRETMLYFSEAEMLARGDIEGFTELRAARSKEGETDPSRPSDLDKATVDEVTRN